jgi:hypothetical protein
VATGAVHGGQRKPHLGVPDRHLVRTLQIGEATRSWDMQLDVSRAGYIEALGGAYVLQQADRSTR